jgi:hypothetical protein
MGKTVALLACFALVNSTSWAQVRRELTDLELKQCRFDLAAVAIRQGYTVHKSEAERKPYPSDPRSQFAEVRLEVSLAGERATLGAGCFPQDATPKIGPLRVLE